MAPAKCTDRCEIQCILRRPDLDPTGRWRDWELPASVKPFEDASINSTDAPCLMIPKRHLITLGGG